MFRLMGSWIMFSLITPSASKLKFGPGWFDYFAHTQYPADAALFLHVAAPVIISPNCVTVYSTVTPPVNFACGGFALELFLSHFIHVVPLGIMFLDYSICAGIHQNLSILWTLRFRSVVWIRTPRCCLCGLASPFGCRNMSLSPFQLLGVIFWHTASIVFALE